MNNAKNNLFLLEEIVKKNFSSKYKDSVIGIFWSVLRPLLTMILLTIIFSTIFGKAIVNYPVYFLSARSVFEFFSASTNTAMRSLKSNKNILTRTAAPKYIFVVGSVISEILNLGIKLIILVFVMIATNAPFHFETIPLAIIPILTLTVMVIGMGFVLSIVCVYYTDIQHLWGVVMMMFMYGSALFYPMEIIPEPYHSFMVLNPLYWIITQFRSFAIYGVMPDMLNMFNAIVLALIVFVFGLIVFKKYEKKITMRY